MSLAFHLVFCNSCFVFCISIFAFEPSVCVATLHAWMVGQGREEGGGAATLLFVCGSANKVAFGIYVGSVECGEVQRSFAIGRPINDVARFSILLLLVQ